MLWVYRRTLLPKKKEQFWVSPKECHSYSKGMQKDCKVLFSKPKDPLLTTRSSISDQGLLFLWNSDHSAAGGNFLSICIFTMWSQGGMKGQNPVSSQKTWHSWALQVCLSWIKLSFARYPWKASGLSEATLWLWFSLHYTEKPYFRKFQSHFILALENYVVIKSGYNTEKQLSEQRIQIS